MECREVPGRMPRASSLLQHQKQPLLQRRRATQDLPASAERDRESPGRVHLRPASHSAVPGRTTTLSAPGFFMPWQRT